MNVEVGFDWRTIDQYPFIAAAEFEVPVAPAPAAFIALMRKVYEVPLVSPVTVALVKVEVPSAKSVHAPPAGRYSTL